MTHKLFVKQSITPRLLLVDGLSRTGKMLVAKLASQLQNVEYFQVCGPVDHVPIIWRLGHLDENSAIGFLRIELDMQIYDRIVGRNLNLRYEDASSIHRAPEFPMYLRRSIDPEPSNEEERLEEMERYKEEGRFPFFFTHEILPHIGLLFSVAEILRVIEVVRHPIDLASSWERRGWGIRWGNDPFAFIPAADHDGQAVPWFAVEWAHEYLTMTPMDRVIRSLLTLFELCRDGYAGLSSEQKRCIHFLAYEHLLGSTESEIERLAAFLETEPFESIRERMAQERLPTQSDTGAMRDKLATIREKASPHLFEQLVDAGRDYEKQWRLDPIVP